MSKSNLDNLLESLLEDYDSWDEAETADMNMFAMEEMSQDLEDVGKIGREVVVMLEMILQEPSESWAEEFHDQVVYWKEQLKAKIDEIQSR